MAIHIVISYKIIQSVLNFISAIDSWALRQEAYKITMCVIYFFFFGHTQGMWKFLGQGSNPRHNPTWQSLTARPLGNSLIHIILFNPGNNSQQVRITTPVFFFLAAPEANRSLWPRSQIGAAATAYTTATSDLSHICDLCPSLGQLRILTEWGQGSNLHAHGYYVRFLTCWTTTGTASPILKTEKLRLRRQIYQSPWQPLNFPHSLASRRECPGFFEYKIPRYSVFFTEHMKWDAEFLFIIYLFIVF